MISENNFSTQRKMYILERVDTQEGYIVVMLHNDSPGVWFQTLISDL
jgi:hypothetical protein